jgi:lipopolysaccharide exporter
LKLFSITKKYILRPWNSIKSSYWIKSGTIVISSRIVQLLLGFIGFLLLIRLLDKEHFGIWIIYITISSFVETIRIGFIKNPVLVLTSDSVATRGGHNSASFILNFCISLIFALLLVLAVWYSGGYIADEPISELVYFYLIKLLFVSVADHFDIVQESKKEFKGTFLDLTSRNLVFVICVGFCYVYSFQLSLYYYVGFQAIGVIFGSILSYRNMVIKNISAFSKPYLNASFLIELLNFGKYTLGSSISSLMMRNVDSWSLAIIMNPVAVAVYNPALRISNLFEIPTSSSTTILLPKLAEKIRNKELGYIKLYYEQSMVYILSVMIPFVLIGFIFSNEIILIIAGEGYEESARLLKYTIFYGLLIPFQRKFSITLDALGRPGLNLFILIFGFLLSVTLNTYFISHFGIFGAAYAMLLTFFLIFIGTQMYLYRKFRINVFEILSSVYELYLKVIRKGFFLFSKQK